MILAYEYKKSVLKYYCINVYVTLTRLCFVKYNCNRLRLTYPTSGVWNGWIINNLNVMLNGTSFYALTFVGLLFDRITSWSFELSIIAYYNFFSYTLWSNYILHEIMDFTLQQWHTYRKSKCEAQPVSNVCFSHSRKETKSGIMN